MSHTAPIRPAKRAPVARARARGVGETSITHVAQRAKVSIGTVSRVINQHPSVDPDLRRRVLVASRELGFVPKLQHRCIAILTGRRSPAMPVGYVSVLVSLISQYLAAKKYAVELIDIENIDLAYQAHIDGAIGVVFDERLARLREIPNLPLLTINKPLTQLGIHAVRTNHHQQAVLATQHLIARGHRRIGFLSIERDEWGSNERLRGHQESLSEAGIPVDPALVQYTIEQPVYDVLNRWMQRGVTGILNFSEDTSLEVLHILSNILKLRIGQDISTISLEDLPIYQYFTPPQTTVSQPMADLARLAVEKVLELCEAKRNGNRPGHNNTTTTTTTHEVIDICLPSTLIERDSVATIGAAASTTTAAGTS